jgi:hypothetical protein
LAISASGAVGELVATGGALAQDTASMAVTAKITGILLRRTYTSSNMWMAEGYPISSWRYTLKPFYYGIFTI